MYDAAMQKEVLPGSSPDVLTTPLLPGFSLAFTDLLA